MDGGQRHGTAHKGRSARNELRNNDEIKRRERRVEEVGQETRRDALPPFTLRWSDRCGCCRVPLGGPDQRPESQPCQVRHSGYPQNGPCEREALERDGEAE